MKRAPQTVSIELTSHTVPVFRSYREKKVMLGCEKHLTSGWDSHPLSSDSSNTKDFYD